MVQSVCPSVSPSVCLSVCHTFLIMFPSSYYHEIYYQWHKWRPCEMSRSDVKVQGHRGQHPTLPLPDRNSSLNSRIMVKWCTILDVALKMCPIVFQGHLSNFKVTRLKKSAILTQIGCFRNLSPVWIHWWLWNDAQSLKQERGGSLLFFKVIRQISRSHGTKNHQIWPELSVSGL